MAQKSDLLLVLGCRLSIRQVSYNWENFAPGAFKIMVDIDPGELLKPTLSIDMPIYADVKDVIRSMNGRLNGRLDNHKKWVDWGKSVNRKFPVCLDRYYEKASPVNPYVFLKELFCGLDNDDAVIVSNGSACICTFQAAYLKEGQRLFGNSGCASMGYGLPAALGVAIERKGKRVICLEGDGSIQMNMQELQTIVHNKLNIKIFWFNNEGYHSIRQTQTNLFSPPMCGVSADNGVSFPEAERIAYAYRIPFRKIASTADIKQKLIEALSVDGPVIIEAVLDPEQFFEPKLSAKRLPDGSMVSPPLEDMFPFLSEEEMAGIASEAESI